MRAFLLVVSCFYKCVSVSTSISVLQRPLERVKRGPVISEGPDSYSYKFGRRIVENLYPRRVGTGTQQQYFIMQEPKFTVGIALGYNFCGGEVCEKKGMRIKMEKAE
jgi:hypothetical protein